jgi:hypothetical protein
MLTTGISFCIHSKFNINFNVCSDDMLISVHVSSLYSCSVWYCYVYSHLHHLKVIFAMYCYRSANSYSCPVCENPLQILAAALPILCSPSSTPEKGIPTEVTPSSSPTPPGQETSAKRSYYMSCLLCRWTSRDCHMDDASVGKKHLFTVLHVFSFYL